MITPLENFNKLPTRQGNRKNVNLSEQLKSAMGRMVSIPIIIFPVTLINGIEYYSAEILCVLSKRQVIAACCRAL